VSNKKDQQVAIWNLYVGAFTAEFNREFKQADTKYNKVDDGRPIKPPLGIERFSFDDTAGTITYVDTISDFDQPAISRLAPSASGALRG
jgi:hypothetical protein